MPAKKNGTARQSASCSQVHAAVNDRATTGASVICTARHTAIVSAKTTL